MGDAIWGIPAGPKGWGPPNTPRADRRVLQLTELSVLRRAALGQKSREIGAALGMSTDSVSRVKRELRKAFGVDTDADLLAHPDVVRQLG